MDTTPIVPQANKKSWGAPAIIIVFVILFSIVVLMYVGGAKRNTTVTTQLSEEKTVVYKGDLNASASNQKLPEGFPVDIPVETAIMEESVKVNYTERGITQYSVVYITEKTKNAVISSYLSFFSEQGYQVSPPSIGENNGPTQVDAKKNNDDLSIVVETTQEGKTRVLLTFLDRS